MHGNVGGISSINSGISMKTIRVLVLTTACLLALAISASAQEGQTVSGTVELSDSTPLPTGARLIVQLLDVSLQDAPATVLAEQVLDASRDGPPYAFTLAYDPTRINARLAYPAYVIEVFVRRGDDLLMTNTEAFPVLTNGAPTDDVHVVADPVER
jgi:putative lipoprotein